MVNFEFSGYLTNTKYTYIKYSCCKFCIYTHTVNSKFTIRQSERNVSREVTFASSGTIPGNSLPFPLGVPAHHALPEEIIASTITQNQLHSNLL